MKPLLRVTPRVLVLGFALLAGLLAAAPDPAPAPASVRPPNIVFILADDLGQRDLGVYGSSFHETPNIDRLAASGVRFSNAYAASPVCSPTRASLLTGKYPARLGITDWLPGRASSPRDRLLAPALAQHLNTADFTLATLLRDAGYRTASIGKWHLGEGPGHFPTDHGFDLNIGGSGKGHPPSYFSPYKLPQLPDGPPGEHLDERLTREAVSFVRSAAKDQKPFLLYLAHYAVHMPLQARPEAVAHFQAKREALPEGEDFSDMPPDGRVRIRQTHPTYAAMVQSLDRSVGALIGALEELGLSANTLILFTSDNGGLSTAEGSPTSNQPLRTGKGWAYEGGVRVPLIVSWPGQLPAAAESHAVVSSPDFLPTLLEFAGVPRPADPSLDGQSFAPLLREPGREAPERTVFWHYPHYSNQRGLPHSALRKGRWKLIEWLEDGRLELYDLVTDPGETRNRATDMAERARLLQAELQGWRSGIGARLPRPNPTFSGSR